MKLQRRGVNLIFPDVLKIEQSLLEMISTQKQVAATLDSHNHQED